MSDFNVSYGCGDYPTNDLSSSKTKTNKRWEKKWDEERRAKGMIQDSTGSWYDPQNPIDCFYADW